jgi:hypothetical protein
MNSNFQLISELVLLEIVLQPPCILPHTLSGTAYCQCLDHTLLFNTALLNIRQNIWFMHDVTSACVSHPARNYLQITSTVLNQYPGQAIHQTWIPLVFIFQDTKKNVTYGSAVNTV